MKLPPGVDGVLSAAVGLFAVLFLGFALAAMATGAAGPLAFVPILPDVVLRLTAVLIFSALYLMVLLPLYRGKAVWALGLMWGFAELVWNAEVAIIAPVLITPAAHLASWWVYMGGVLLLFSASAYRLRHDLRRARLTSAMVIGILLFTPVRALVLTGLAPGVPLLGNSPFEVLTSEMPEYALIISTVLLLVRRGVP